MKEIKKVFTDELSLFGFKKQSKDWFYTNENLVVVVNLQKSNYEKLYFLNIGIWLNEIGGENINPKENVCHIRMRAERLFDSIPQNLNPRELFDFNNSILEEKVKDVKTFLCDYFCPMLIKLTDVDSLKLLYREHLFKYAYIENRTRELLSLNN